MDLRNDKRADCREILYDQDIDRIEEFNDGVKKICSSNDIMSFLNEFIELSRTLSSMLPSVSIESLFDVDELLGQIDPVPKKFLNSKELYRRLDLKSFCLCCCHFIEKDVRNIFINTALMGLAEYMEVDSMSITNVGPKAKIM